MYKLTYPDGSKVKFSNAQDLKTAVDSINDKKNTFIYREMDYCGDDRTLSVKIDDTKYFIRDLNWFECIPDVEIDDHGNGVKFNFGKDTVYDFSYSELGILHLFFQVNNDNVNTPFKHSVYQVIGK
jgi:hypothetical protein